MVMKRIENMVMSVPQITVAFHLRSALDGSHYVRFPVIVDAHIPTASELQRPYTCAWSGRTLAERSAELHDGAVVHYG